MGLGQSLYTCYSIKDLDTGLYKRQRDYQFDVFSSMTALYKNKKRAEYETHRFKEKKYKNNYSKYCRKDRINEI